MATPGGFRSFVAKPEAVGAITHPGLEYTALPSVMEYTAATQRMHYTALPNRIHYTARGEDA